MSKPAARQGDKVIGTDNHLCQDASGVTFTAPLPFTGTITSGCSTNVVIGGQPAAIVGATAMNTPPHVPPGTNTFVNPPTNQGQLLFGSGTVLINNKPAVRAGDKVQTCNDPAPLPSGTVVSTSTVLIGG